MDIVRAKKEHISEVSSLFDLYRQFYECEADITLATQFITERITNDESVIFLAREDNAVIGFVQLYPSYCSVNAVKIFILYDLYVDTNYRKSGVGKQLMNRASQFAKAAGASRLDLLTAFSNKAGQHLYEKLGYKIVNDDFHAYSLEL
ncbi:MAG: ribosomal protein S18 acetylase RimI-like enzyme [Enterobacterales bacterium]|jgi:ribosomal protein S18 acetylase RimI-like enzyme